MRWLRNRGERSWIPKIHVLGVCLACFLSSANVGWAVSKFFYEDGTIQEGEIYSYVGIYDNATVDMTGGEVTWGLVAYDTSTVNISGGFVQSLGGGDSTKINILGAAEGDILRIISSSSVNMSGGTFNTFEAYNSATGILRGGTVSDYLLAYGTKELSISIYGYGLAYNPDAGSYGGGQVIGLWENGTPFSIDLYYSDTPGGPIIDTWSHITLHEIPEPCTLALIVIGAIILPRRRRNKKIC